VIGKPYSGKTKEAIEEVRKIRRDLTTLIPEGKGTISQFEGIPNEIKGDVLLFLDDLPRYYVEPKKFQDSLERTLEMLKNTCASVSIVATARSTELEKLYEYPSNRFWDNFETIKLGEFERTQTEQLLDELCERFNMTIDAGAKNRIAKENDRTPKNPVIFFNWLKSKEISHITAEIVEEFKPTVLESWNEIYNGLSETEKKIFQALDVLQKGLIIPHKVFIVDLIAKQGVIFKLRRRGIEKTIETLVEKHLVDEQENIIRCDDAYLEGKGDFYTNKNIKNLVDILLKRSKREEIKFPVLFSLMGLFDVLQEKREFIEENVKIIRKIIELTPELAVAHNNLGSLLVDLKRNEESETEYREAIRIKPDYAEAHYNLGNLLKNLKRYEESEAEYREAIRINPDLAEAHNNLGLLLKNLKRYEESETEYREAIRINPDYAEAHNNLGLLLHNLKRYEESETEYREAIRINPDYAEAHNNLGLLLHDLKRYKESETEYREAIRINPDLAEAHYNLGLLLHDLKRYEESETEYREAIRINPDDAEAHYNLGILLHDLKRYEESEREYREAIRINPDDAEAHNNLGILLHDLKRYEESERECREAIRIKPDDAEAHYNLGYMLKDLKRYEESEREYREAIRINPDYAEAHYNLGNLLKDLGRYEESEREYREAIRIKPNLAEAHANLGILFSKTGKREEAKKELRTAKELFEEEGREEDVKKMEELLKLL
jgi:Tfp pilus assembly protein PilF